MSMQRLARNITLAGMVLLFPVSAAAQEAGVKAGVNFASLTPAEDESPDISRRRGLVAGGWVRMPSANRFSLQAEGLFSEKGVRFNISELGIEGSADVRLRYLEVPVLARADFGAPASPTRVFVVGGLAPAFKLSGRGKTDLEGEDTHIQDLDDEVRSFDLGLVGGGGIQAARALIEFRYTHGLRHINTDDNGEGDRIKNRVFSVTLGFRLR